jgi:hypothetical protein
MKRLTYSLALLMFLLNACSGNSSQKEKVVSIPNSADTSSVESELARILKGHAAFKNKFDKENPFDWTIDYAFYKCETCELAPYQKAINEMVSEFFDANNKTSKLDLSFFEGVFKNMDKDQREMNADSEYPMPFGLDGTVEITESDNCAQLYLQQYVFLGGAHGSTTVEYFQVDKESGKKLGLKDFISSKSKLDRLAEKYFRKQNEIPLEGTLMDHGFDSEFSCNENFFLQNDSLFFFYNQYEIACYAMGSFQFGIPLKDLKGLLIRKP